MNSLRNWQSFDSTQDQQAHGVLRTTHVLVANYIAALQFLNTKEVLDGLSAGRPGVPLGGAILAFR